MIRGLYEAHLPVSNLNRSIEFYVGLGLQLDHKVEDNLAFLWIEKDKSWLGLWETEKVEVDYHPSLRHIAFQVSLEDLKSSVAWLKDRGYAPREAFGFLPVEPFVMPHGEYAHAKIHFNDPDGNSLEFISKLENSKIIKNRMYLSEWEQINECRSENSK
ncbi:VOC family protein [Peribacillus frigoritolerans]|jgi:catechol 2,3-dioxygenase-like lactoylglutathione lyase family enzyme|uniref:VOC family protein n=1 Tax=Peribacillus frigoritolerans TaxID=450367 RepID=UPI0017850C3C|nr:VOC family protein [Peribacillus frigoritolerans]MBD8134456.1 VOC family protein [Bacillus sp. CFBP 13597]MCR8868268.1 VOC family protein [Peribacillus frigoritolerans]MDG4846842.1 VOC family protein [Peribacillus frigoritolerans]WVN09974.1 VOC family protein [Peribacillus frigoritolerans]